ncbi:ligase-associated DNA damage response exonuclease [Lutimaribacter marinistellae]|uniref:Ligase-associated DNA damage response exonuclease n=1 Tax=Lutimaribacter marinistellae TaxID=1820329 RepID=A0ABV7TKR8_9RHOB
MVRDPVISFTDRGLYCSAGDFYIDPWRRVDRALITHGHSDHARPGHQRYLCTPGAAPTMRHRLGEIDVQTIHYGRTLTLGDASVSFHPAGHVPGSAQIRVEVAGEVWVVSGDYKTTPDGLAEAFEPVSCHAFITESTFGLPVFQWRPQEEVAAELNAWWRDSLAAGKRPVLGAYSLGKAQRLLSLLDPDIGPILTHGAVEAMTAILRDEQGYDLPATIPVTPDTNPKDHPDALLLAPPSAVGSAWSRRFGSASTGFASGWMQLRGVRRRRAMDRGFVISDHADWDGLNTAIDETGAEKIFVTHGYTEIFTRWLNDRGLQARIVETEFTGDDGEGE